MISFIIYEDEEKMREVYKNVIHGIFAKNNNAYKIYEFSKYDEFTEKELDDITGKKIYLLDIEVPGKVGIEFARAIRQSGDWFSQIIIISSHDDLRIESFMSKILMLDFIYKGLNIKKCLTSSIMSAYDILLSGKSLSIKQNGEIHKILYGEILYVEKNLNDNYVTIFTKNTNLTMKCSINNLEKLLNEDPRFMKIHRSCIINLNKVKSYDIINNIIYFDNCSINLVSRTKKKELKNRLIIYNGI